MKKQMKEFVHLLSTRRSRYELTDSKDIDNKNIIKFIGKILKTLPSPGNFQTTRLVLLLDDSHKKYGDAILKNASPRSQESINRFLYAHGTILFFTDETGVRRMEKTFPDYAHACANGAREANAMAQYAIGTGLSSLCYGANIQHYEMAPGDLNREYQLPKEWKFISAMSFGIPSDKLNEHSHLPTEEVLLIKE